MMNLHYIAIGLLFCVSLHSYSQNIVRVAVPGSLTSQLTQAQKDTCTQLTVQGKLNSADIRVLRQMAGYKEEGGSTGQLSTLNLADAEFVTDKEPYMVLDAKEEHLSTTATPARISKMAFRMGESFTERHKIHYEKYQQENWRDDSGYRWDPVGQVYVPRYELMTVYSESVAYYHAKYILGSENEVDKRPKVEHFQFTNNFNDKHWKWLRKEHLTHIKGHRIVKDGDRYLLYVYSHKDFLPDDMFYDCDRLQTVILPKMMKVDNSLVIDETSTIKYQLPWDEIMLYYRSRERCNYIRKIPGEFGRHEEDGDKMKIIYDATSTNLYKVLKELQPAKPNSKYVANIRACFVVNYADGRKPVRYEIDSDMKHIVVNKDSLYCKMNDALLHELKKLNVSTWPYVKPTPNKESIQYYKTEVNGFSVTINQDLTAKKKKKKSQTEKKNKS